MLGIRSEAVAILLDQRYPTVSVQHNDAGWSGADRCPAAEPSHFEAHAPVNFLVTEGPGKSGTPIVALQSDRLSLKQGLPFARCMEGGPGSIAFEEPAGDLDGDGLHGANGGSGLSALGGVIRLGELAPDAAPPRHALAIHLFGSENLNKSATAEDCFRWPASRGDAGCTQRYAGVEPALRMGSLLALPHDKRPGLRTQAAEKLAWTLENYGAYVVNDAGSSSYAFNVELSPAGWFDDDFESAWGFAFQTTDTGSDWANDVQLLFAALAVVDDNAPATPGGAGVRLQPSLGALAP